MRELSNDERGSVTTSAWGKSLGDVHPFFAYDERPMFILLFPDDRKS